MNILVVGGTRFFGKQLVWELLGQGHTVAVATRGKTPNPFGGRVTRIALDRTDSRSVRDALGGADYDLVYDNIAYASNDVRRLLDTVRTDRYILTSSTAVYDKKINTVETDFDPLAQPVSWGERAGFSYAEGKRQAEGALFPGIRPHTGACGPLPLRHRGRRLYAAAALLHRACRFRRPPLRRQRVLADELHFARRSSSISRLPCRP